MPGSPPSSPNFGIARYSDSDAASFSEQVNAITDGFDAEAMRLPGAPTARSLVFGTIYQPNVTRPVFVLVQGFVAPGDSFVAKVGVSSPPLDTVASLGNSGEYSEGVGVAGTIGFWVPPAGITNWSHTVALRP